MFLMISLILSLLYYHGDHIFLVLKPLKVFVKLLLIKNWFFRLFGVSISSRLNPKVFPNMSDIYPNMSGICVIQTPVPNVPNLSNLLEESYGKIRSTDFFLLKIYIASILTIIYGYFVGKKYSIDNLFYGIVYILLGLFSIFISNQINLLYS